MGPFLQHQRQNGCQHKHRRAFVGDEARPEVSGAKVGMAGASIGANLAVLAAAALAARAR